MAEDYHINQQQILPQTLDLFPWQMHYSFILQCGNILDYYNIVYTVLQFYATMYLQQLFL